MFILEQLQKYGVYREVAPGEYAGPCPECGGAMRFRVRVAENQGRCLSCRFVLPAEATAPVAAAGESAGVSFDSARMLQQISDLRSRIQTGWDADGWRWLEANRADITGFITQKENAIDPLFAEENEKALERTMQVLEEAYRKAWAIYAERPPVIERQDVLFDTTPTIAER